jgi:hypothetical protein
MSPEYRHDKNYSRVWIAIAIGAAIGVAYAASRSKKGGWAMAKRVTREVAENREEIADTGRDIIERIGLIYDEARKVVEEAGELWEHGRRLLRRAA